MGAARDWDALVEDINFMRSTGENQHGVLHRLRETGQYRGSAESLSTSLHRRGKDATLVAWFKKEAMTDQVKDLFTRDEARKVNGHTTQAFN